MSEDMSVQFHLVVYRTCTHTQASSQTRQVVVTWQLIISQIYQTLLYLKISPPPLYSTCSFTILRTPDQVTWALKFWLPRQFKDSHTPFMILTSLPHLLTDLPSCSTGGFRGPTSEPASFSVVSPQMIWMWQFKKRPDNCHLSIRKKDNYCSGNWIK